MNYMKLEMPFTFRYSEFDIYDQLMPQYILSALQDIAGEHAQTLGVGYKPMIEKDMIWVIVRTRYQVIKRPEVDTKYTLITWPLAKGLIDFNRDYLLVDEKGETVIKATSKWAVTNFKTRRLVRGRDVTYFGGDYYPHKNFEEDLKNFDDIYPEKFEHAFSHIVRFTDLDHNHHMNNTKYATLVLDALKPSPDEYIQDLQINFLVESQIDDVLDIFIQREEDFTYVIGINKESQKSIFIAKVIIAKK